MKVYGIGIYVNINGENKQVRAIACCKSLRRFAELVQKKESKETYYTVKKYTCPTRNEKEIAIAQKHSDKLIITDRWDPEKVLEIL